MALRLAEARAQIAIAEAEVAELALTELHTRRAIVMTSAQNDVNIARLARARSFLHFSPPPLDNP